MPYGPTRTFVSPPREKSFIRDFVIIFLPVGKLSFYVLPTSVDQPKKVRLVSMHTSANDGPGRQFTLSSEALGRLLEKLKRCTTPFFFRCPLQLLRNSVSVASNKPSSSYAAATASVYIPQSKAANLLLVGSHCHQVIAHLIQFCLVSQRVLHSLKQRKKWMKCWNFCLSRSEIFFVWVNTLRSLPHPSIHVLFLYSQVGLTA